MYSFTLSLTSALDGAEWSTVGPSRFTPGKDPVPIVQEAGWALQPVWTGAENLASSRIRSPDRPARSQSLVNECIFLKFVVFVFYDIDIFINCNWVVTRWQYTFTHKHYIEQHK
jgi:hypothetical protein